MAYPHNSYPTDFSGAWLTLALPSLKIQIHTVYLYNASYLLKNYRKVYVPFFPLKRQFADIQDKLRKQITQRFSDDDRFKRIDKKELIKEDLLSFVENMEKRQLIEEFKDFNFTSDKYKYFENVDDDKNTFEILQTEKMLVKENRKINVLPCCHGKYLGIFLQLREIRSVKSLQMSSSTLSVKTCVSSVSS